MLAELLLAVTVHLAAGKPDVVCDRERAGADWWWESTEYFTCPAGQHCCGDHWSRTCCHQEGPDTAFVTGLVIFLGLLTITLAVLSASCYHYKEPSMKFLVFSANINIIPLVICYRLSPIYNPFWRGINEVLTNGWIMK